MKDLDVRQLEAHPGLRLQEDTQFSFRCHPGISCFNRCCRNLNLFLYPYDVIRLKHSLKISSDVFLERHVDLVLREGNFFPEVLLKMSENEEKSCPFLAASGCSVYTDRPDACRTFPVEQAMLFDREGRPSRILHFFRPPDFCLGQFESTTWTSKTWEKDQDAAVFHAMTRHWAELKAMFSEDPWGEEGPGGKRAKMTFMALYNVDLFRGFVLKSSFLKRFRVKPEVLKKIKHSDTCLLRFGFEWVQFFLWRISPQQFNPK